MIDSGRMKRVRGITDLEGLNEESDWAESLEEKVERGATNANVP